MTDPTQPQADPANPEPETPQEALDRVAKAAAEELYNPVGDPTRQYDEDMLAEIAGPLKAIVARVLQMPEAPWPPTVARDPANPEGGEAEPKPCPLCSTSMVMRQGPGITVWDHPEADCLLKGYCLTESGVETWNRRATPPPAPPPAPLGSEEVDKSTPPMHAARLIWTAMPDGCTLADAHKVFDMVREVIIPAALKEASRPTDAAKPAGFFPAGIVGAPLTDAGVEAARSDSLWDKPVAPVTGAELEAENARLKEALEPFAEVARCVEAEEETGEPPIEPTEYVHLMVPGGDVGDMRWKAFTHALAALRAAGGA